MKLDNFNSTNSRLFLLAFLIPTLILGIPLAFGLNFNAFFGTILAFLFPTFILGTPLFLHLKNRQSEQERLSKIETLTLTSEILEGLESGINDPAKDMRDILSNASLDDLIRLNKAIEKLEIAIAGIRKTYNIVGEIYADTGLSIAAKSNNNQNKGNNGQNNGQNNNQNNGQNKNN